MLEDYLRRVFLLNPFADEDLRSFVYEHKGRPMGFIGVIPRPFVLRDQPIRVAVSTQFVMDPEVRGLATLQMVRHLFAGPQDLTLADAGPTAMRNMWVGLGGEAAWPYSLMWDVRIDRIVTGTQSRSARLTGRALPLVPRGMARWLVAQYLAETAPVSSSPADPMELAGLAGSIIKAPLMPVYDGPGLAWVVAQAGEKEGTTEVVCRRVADPAGVPVGWFVYRVSVDGSGYVLQIGAAPGEGTQVLRGLIADAWKRNVRQLRGGAEPGLLSDYDALGIGAVRKGPWVLVQSRRPGVLAALNRGEAWLSNLDGERYLSF